MNAVDIRTDKNSYLVKTDNDMAELTFDYVYITARAIAEAMNNSYLTPDPSEHGTLACYKKYSELTILGENTYRREGKKCTALLNPNLVGLEGKRVQLLDSFGKMHRFYLEVSPGWLPCHVKKKTLASNVGEGILHNDKFTEIKIIRQR